MKRNKAINVTKRNIRSAIVEDRNYCYHYYPENARTHIKQTPLGFDYNFKDLDLQNVSNWSHLTCSCRDSIGKYQEASYFTTKLKQMPPKVTDIGVGNVKAYQRRKAKRIYMPQTEERAIGTSNNEYPKCHHFNEPTHRTIRNFVERPVNKKHMLNKKLSPLVRKKSNYTSPLTTLFRKQDLEHNVSTTLSIHNQVNASTQMDKRELEKYTKIKIFKDLATNTELENGKPLKSEVELSVEVSRVLSSKLGTGSSLDSLVQHVYNLDKPCNATLSTATIDPMENKLEREYRKIFSNQFKDCACNNKISAANSDSLLRRFEALKRDISLKGELKKNISKTSSPPNEPKYKDVSVDSDGASVAESDIKKIDSPISSDFVVSDHQTKGRFKLWGRKISADDGHHKKSKLKCSNSKKRSEASVKFSKLLKAKSSVKKEGKKFRFFKKKMKAAPISRTDVMTGRCEVREGMSVQIGKELLTQDHNTKAIQKFRLKYEDNLLHAWIRNFLTKSDHAPRNRSAKYSSSLKTYYSSFDIGENSSSETDVQFTTTATVTNNSSFQKVNKSPFINFSNQYIEAWMLTKTILDRLVKPKIYWNARTDKFNQKKNIDIDKYCDCKDTNPKINVPVNNDDKIKEKITPKPKSIMIDISLGCMSDLIHQSFEMQSNEEVCKITDYETPRQSTMNILKQSFEKEKCNEIISEYCMKDNTNCRFNDTENLKKKKSSYRAGIFQDNEIEAPKTCHAVGIESATQNNLGKWDYPVYDISTEESGDDLEGTVLLLPKTYKHSDVYLQKFYHNWNPLDLDLWCISDTNLQPSYNVNKDIDFRSYSNMTDDIQYTTLVSSCETFRHCVKDKGKKALLKSHNNDYLSHNIGIRITPKDSLEVCKKRKLYSESNKGRWIHDELSISLSSSTKSKNHFKKFITLTPNKKRVTISNYEVDKESKPITKENDLRKKYLHCLSSSYHVSDSIQAARKLSAKLEKKPTRQNIAITATSSGITNRTCNQCDSSEVKCLKSASKDNVLNVADSCITNWKRRLYCEKSSGEERKNSEKIKDTKSGFLSEYFKPSCRKKNKYHRICRKLVADKKSSGESDKNCQNSKFYQEQSCQNLREQMKSEFKHCSITTDVQELSSLPSVEDKSCGATICIGSNTDVSKKGKLIGLHLKKQPLRKNVSRACWTTGDKLESSNTSTVTTTKCSTKETPRMTCKSPPISPSVSKSLKKEIKNCVTVQKELNNVDNKNKDSNDEIKNTPCVIRRNIDITPNIQSTSDSGRRICLGFDATRDDQSNDKSDCDFIEIVFKIRRKHGDDRAMVVNIKDSKDRIIKDIKTNLSGKDSDCNSNTKEVYLLQNESGNSALRRNSKNCMNVKILIKNCINDELNKTSELTDSNISISSKRSVEKNQSTSSRTVKAVNNYAYSVHKFTINLTKSAKSNNSLKENYAILHSDKGTVISETDFQKIDIINSSEVINNRSNENIKYNRKCNGSRKHKYHTNKIKNEKLYYSSATLRPDRSHSLTKQMSNYKHLKNRVLQKIVDCAKDFNKGMKKEKRMRKRSNMMASLDYSNRNIFDQNVNRLSNEIGASTLYSHFLNDTGSYGHCNFDRSKSKVNDYLFTFETKDRNEKINPSYSTSEYEKKKRTTILATKLGLKDTRKRQARWSVRHSDNCHRRFKNIKKPNHCFDNELDFLYDLSNYDIDSCELNSYLRHMDKEAIRTDESEQFQQSNIDNNINLHRLHKDVVCVSDERKITVVSSKYLDEKCISCDECGLEETCNHRKETFDIFQLSEIKRAVFEMYNSKEISSKTESLNLPKFESDVENALI